MNRRLPQALLFLICLALLPVQAQEQEYNESKLFPKRGKYLDWIEANKLNNQGVRYARQGNYKSAVELFRRAIQRYSHDYAYYENLGAALHNSGNLERAESTTEMAAQMSPRRWGPWYNLGIILTKEHQYARALKALNKAKALHAPASKTAGINKLIVALEKKLRENDNGPAAPNQSEVQAEADSENEANSSISSSPAQNSSPNPYTTIPAVSPLPVPPATSVEKGN
ncbi:MAG TPA: tetratricopeptide repeat protein [Candidatus Melainabacteria bacterium]|nr:tetratricopeptide repeat protein [Candidatus Melainabacteria bacterium]